MIINKSTLYKRTLRKEIINKHLSNELDRVQNIENFLLEKDNFKEVIDDPLHNIYGIVKKKGNLNELYTAKLNDKMRLFLRPIGKYPYNLVEITEITFENIDNTHYGEG